MLCGPLAAYWHKFEHLLNADGSASFKVKERMLILGSLFDYRGDTAVSLEHRLLKGEVLIHMYC